MSIDETSTFTNCPDHRRSDTGSVGHPREGVSRAQASRLAAPHALLPAQDAESLSYLKILTARPGPVAAVELLSPTNNALPATAPSTSASVELLQDHRTLSRSTYCAPTDPADIARMHVLCARQPPRSPVLSSAVPTRSSPTILVPLPLSHPSHLRAFSSIYIILQLSYSLTTAPLPGVVKTFFHVASNRENRP